MKHVAHSQSEIHSNSPTCTVNEYGGIGSLDGADIQIDGRYPETGFAVNEKSDMVVRVLSGSGQLATKEAIVALRPSDVVFVAKGEAYYFDGQKLALFMACTPAWSIDQYREMA